MDRPYDDIPRQGEHPSKPVETEHTTNVRAQQPAHPLDRSKQTQSFHVLSVNKDKGMYRLNIVSKEAETDREEGFEEVARVPVGGDLGGLFERIPDLSQHAVFEESESGMRHFSEDRRLADNWTGEGEFDSVTIFSDKEEATAYAKEVKESPSAK